MLKSNTCAANSFLSNQREPFSRYETELKHIVSLPRQFVEA